MHSSSPTPVVNPFAAPSSLPAHPTPRSSSVPLVLHRHSSPLSSSSLLPPLPSFRPLPPHLPAFKPRSHCTPPSSATLSTLSSTSSVSSRSTAPIPTLNPNRSPPTPFSMPPSQPPTPPRRRSGRRTAANSNLQCPTCLQFYSRRDNLRAHQRVHTGERPFSCRYCAQPFRWQGALRNHEGIHIRNGDALPSDSASRQHRSSASSSPNNNSNSANRNGTRGTNSASRNASRGSSSRGSSSRGSANRTAPNRTTTTNNNHNSIFANSATTPGFVLMPSHHSSSSSQHQLFAQLQHAPYFHAGSAASNAPSSSGIPPTADATDIAPFDAHHESRANVVVTGVESDFPRLDWGSAVLDDLSPRADRSRE